MTDLEKVIDRLRKAEQGANLLFRWGDLRILLDAYEAQQQNIASLTDDLEAERRERERIVRATTEIHNRSLASWAKEQELADQLADALFGFKDENEALDAWREARRG